MLGYTRTFGTQSGGQDIWLLKLNSSLDSMWSKTYDLGGEDAGVDIMPFNNKYIILANSCTEDCNTTAGGLGFFKSGAFYMLIDTLGNLDTVYNISPGLKNHFKSIQPTNDGGAVIAGSTDAVALNYAPDLWVLKLNANLDTIWTRTYGDSGAYDGCRGVFQQPDGNYIAGGYSQSFVIPGIRDFDCPWVIKLNQNGDSIWSFISGTENNDGIMQIIPASDGSIVATGYYGLDSKPESLFDLDLGEGQFYLLKLADTLQSGMAYSEAGQSIVIFPNPAYDGFFIEASYQTYMSGSVITVYDVLGREILKMPLTQQKTRIETKGWQKGLYIVNIITKNGINTGKLMVK